MKKIGFFYISYLYLCLVACKIGDSNNDRFYRALCINLDTIFSKQLIEQKRFNADNLLHINNLIADSIQIDDNTKLKSVQKIIYNRQNLKEVDIDKHSFQIERVLFDQYEMEVFIRLKEGLLLNELSDLELTTIKQGLTIKPSNYQDWYNQIRLLLILAKHYKTIHETQKQYATLLYALHLIHTHDKPENLGGLNDEIINFFITNMTKEDNFEQYLATIYQVQKLYAKEKKETFTKSLTDAYLQEELSLRGMPNSYHSALQKTAQKAKSKADSVIILLNFANYYSMNGDYEQSRLFFQKTLDLYPSPMCNMMYFQVLLTCLSSPMSQKLADFYTEELNHYKQCSKQIQDQVTFAKDFYISDENTNKQKHTIISDHVKSSQLAAKSFPGRSTLHLQSYYLDNLLEICDLFEQGELVQNDLKKTIVNQFLEVRSRDRLRQEIFRDPLAGIENQKERERISEILLNLNNLKDVNQIIDPQYEELFQLLILSEQKQKEPKYERKKLVFSDFKNQFSDKCLLNFFRGTKNYIAYSYLNNEVKIWKFETKKIDSILNREYNKILEKKENLDKLTILFEDLLPLTIDKDVIIVSDGILVNFPMNLVFYDSKSINYYPSIQEYMDKKDILVQPSELCLVSYSSTNTLKSRKVKKYPELPNGLEECKAIATLYGKNNNYISGINFTATNTLFSNKKMIHFSTHAKSNTLNSFDNYIVTRDDLSKTYGFELYGSKNLPEIVVLSACETGIGLHQYGAGVQTLSRAFLDNGTQTVIKTLWKVNEKATAKFMVDMYTNWAEGINLYDALKKTKESFKTHPKYSHPYYWAGFVLEGNPNVKLELNGLN